MVAVYWYKIPLGGGVTDRRLCVINGNLAGSVVGF
jgi:hypothetical protein